MNNSTKKANVIVIGNSGVGKSTLINSIFGNREEPELAETGKGEGITQKMDIYENDNNKKITIRYNLGSKERTLTSEELENFKTEFINHIRTNKLEIQEN